MVVLALTALLGTVAWPSLQSQLQRGRRADAVAFGRDYPEFWMQTPINGQPATLGNGSHFGFVAPDKASVHAFHEAALAAGGQDEGQQIDIQPLQLTVLVLHAKGRPEVGHHP